MLSISEMQSLSMMVLPSRVLLSLTIVGILGACTLPPPDTVPGMAARLTTDRVLFDPAKVAEITGSSDLLQNEPTRIAGVDLDDFSIRYNRIREIKFNLRNVCVRVADIIQYFGKPSGQTLITDGGGLNVSWEVHRPGGDVTIALSRMQKVDECAKELWIAQPWHVPYSKR